MAKTHHPREPVDGFDLYVREDEHHEPGHDVGLRHVSMSDS